MKIRAVLPRDVAGILDLFESVAAENLWLATEPGFDREQYREFISLSSQRTQQTVAFVAVAGRKTIAGHISASRDADSGRWSLGMLVAKEYRRLGAGSALLRILIEWAQKAKVSELYLEVFPHNESALALYRRFGFVQRAYHKKQLLRRNGELWDTIEMVLAVRDVPPPKN